MKKIIKTIIVDDDKASIERLQKDLSNMPEIMVIDSTTSAKIGKQLIINKQPDLLFLDVEMPEMSGFDLLNEIKSDINPNMCIIFYTAYDKYIIDALRASAFDYLTKPYLPEELESVVFRVKKSISDTNIKLEKLLHKLINQDDRFAVQAITGIQMVKYDDVMLFDFPKNKRNWDVIFTSGKRITLRATITSKDILSITPSFVQVNQKCIINIKHLVSIENRSLKCEFYSSFENIEEVIVKPKYYKQLREMLDVL